MTKEEFCRHLPEMVNNYQPSTETLEKLKKVSLLMIIGPSGAGKTTLIKRLGLPYVPSDTTRAIRPEEKAGVDYIFRSDYDQLAADIKTGRFVQVAVGSGGDFYGTKARSYPDFGWATMAVVADVISIFRGLGFAKTISAFITPPSYEAWIKRMQSHVLKPDQLEKRLKEAKRSFEFALTDNEVHLVLNDELEPATSQLKQLLDGKKDLFRELAAANTAQNIHATLIRD